MTARYDDDRLLSAWLHDRAPSREPEHLLGQVLARTARTRRRPAWRNPERLHLMSAIASRFAPAAPVPWRLLGIAAALLLALVAGLVLLASGAFRSPAPAYGLAANGALFYSEGGDIVLRSGASGIPRPVIVGATTDDSPVISFDGTRFSFLRHLNAGEAEIWVANIDGSNPQKLDIGGTRPGWFEWAADGRSAVVIEDAHPLRLTVATLGAPPFTAELEYALQDSIFRPGHASQIAFIGTAASGDRAIFIINADGSGLAKLELDRGYMDDPLYSVDKGSYFWQMAWSPEGGQVAYVTVEPNAEADDGRGWRLHMATVDGAGVVSNDRLLIVDREADDEFSPVWLPDGRSFIFQGVEGARHWLSLATIDGAGAVTARPLGVEANDYIGVQVSPDGKSLIAQIWDAGAVQEIQLVDIASGIAQALPVGQDVSWQRLAP